MGKIRIIFILCGLLIQWSAGAHVNLKSPKGGETFHPGESVKIEWEVAIEHETENWDLYFSTDGGKTFEVVELDINVKTLSYDWSVPYTSTKDAQIKIVQDNKGQNYSDASGNFTIAGTSTASVGVIKQSGIRFFPNPSSYQIQMRLSPSSPAIQKIEVFDDLGRLMDSLVPARRVAGEEYSIDVSHWLSGFYFVAVTMEEGVGIYKLVVQ